MKIKINDTEEYELTDILTHPYFIVIFMIVTLLILSFFSGICNEPNNNMPDKYYEDKYYNEGLEWDRTTNSFKPIK